MKAIRALKVENWSLFSSTESIALSEKKKLKEKARREQEGKDKKG